MCAGRKKEEVFHNQDGRRTNRAAEAVLNGRN